MKSRRQKKIIELIDKYEIETQEELGSRLLEAGFQVTQATISRDIRELCLMKVPGENGRQKYAVMGTSGGMSERYARVLRDGMISMSQADNILVIKTVSGMAMAVAAALDNMQCDEIVGSIAGDDTIMCAVRTSAEAQSLLTRLKKLATE